MTAATMAASRALQQQEKAVKQTTNAFGSAVQEIRRYDLTQRARHGRTRQGRQVRAGGPRHRRCGTKANKAAQPMNVGGGGCERRIRASAWIEGRICCRGSGFAGILLKLGDAMSW